jgi:SAM-dependent methyltransferase
MMNAVGISSIEAFFVEALAVAAHDRQHDGPARFCSIGAGNCDAEVHMAVGLQEHGIRDFVIECFDLNPLMLERGHAQARELGVGDHIVGVDGDFNRWVPNGLYDGFVANQALHHVINLEGLFDGIAAALRPPGRFIVSDMIGRNGHQRWPEARAIVESFWSELPEAYRYHHTLRRDEREFLDWDCSVEGFEGVRAQDIMPLLVDRFAFESFLAFGNVIDVFVDRGFGPNFEVDASWDRAFIDRVHARDVEALLSGEVKPTHLIATMRLAPVAGGPKVWSTMTPEFAVRRP